jgi:pyrroline-5-carboxylate reductase
MTPERVGFIGAGHLANAMIRGFITSGYLDPGQIVISDIDDGRLRQVHETLGPAIAPSNLDNAERCDVLFLAVKPAQIVPIAEEIAPAMRAGRLVVSVAAGTALARVRDALGPQPTVCRIMPNLAAGVRRSTIGLYAEEAVEEEALQPIYALLSQVGKVFRIADEGQMAAITALSGSAPAYYVMMAEALVNYGVAQGLPEQLVAEMILSTMEGTAAWARQAKVPLGPLWRRVVTAGGTTEAGTRYYDDKGFVEIFVEGLARSTERARELGDS